MTRRRQKQGLLLVREEPWTIKQSVKSESYAQNTRSGYIADGHLVPSSFVPLWTKYPSSCLAGCRLQLKRHEIIQIVFIWRTVVWINIDEEVVRMQSLHLVGGATSCIWNIIGRFS